MNIYIILNVFIMHKKFIMSGPMKINNVKLYSILIVKNLLFPKSEYDDVDFLKINSEFLINVISKNPKV